MTPAGRQDPIGAPAAAPPVPGPLVPILLALATGLAFGPTLGNGFVDWDDNRNFLTNPHYRGLGREQLAWMLTAFHGGHYVPLTWLSLGLDYVLWGMRPAGYHLTSLAIHVGAVLVFWSVARQLLARATAWSGPAVEAGAAVAALVFGIHPLRVESVAWVTERRDVLSGALALVTVRLYLAASAAGGRRRAGLLAGSVAAYALALLSKSIVLMLPVALLVLDGYPLRRLRGGPRAWLAPAARAVWREKLPYLALSAAAALVAYRAQLADRGINAATAWWERAANVAFSLWFYLSKTVRPVGLSALYEAPVPIDPRAPRFVGAALGVAGVTLLVWVLRRAWPAGLAAWAAHVVLLAPVCGAVSLGVQLAADRYSYVACLPWALLAGAGAGAVVQARGDGRLRRWLWRGAVGTAAVCAVALAGLTWRQTEVWHDSERLWQHAVAEEPDCWVCQLNAGQYLLDRGERLAALPHFHRALLLRPDRTQAYRSLGLALAGLGRDREAIAWYERGLALQPQAVDLRASLAAALIGRGRRQEGLDQLTATSRYYPPAALARYFRGAVGAEPGALVPHLGLAHAYTLLGDRERAREQYEIVQRLDPELARLARDAWRG